MYYEQTKVYDQRAAALFDDDIAAHIHTFITRGQRKQLLST